MIKKLNFKKYYYDIIARIKALKGTPHDIALGMGVGIFTAFTPTFPFQTFIAILIAFILRGSKAAAIIGSLFSNPITIPFIYLGAYKIGIMFTGSQIIIGNNFIGIKELFKQGPDIAFTMLLGGAVLGLIAGIPAYFITKRAFIH
jgi:uncharacterized protein